MSDSPTVEKTTSRTEVINYLIRILYGPRDGESEELEGTPFLRYMTGMLFPIGDRVEMGEGEVTATADEPPKESERDDLGREVGPDGVELAFEALPSAVGISFRTKDDAEVRCEVWGARYVAKERPQGNLAGRARRNWKRESIATKRRPEVTMITKNTLPQKVFGGSAEVVTRWRSRTDGSAIVTVSLVNRQKARTGRGLDPAATLFQVGLKCTSQPSGILAYPDVDSLHDDASEETEVAFLYRKAAPFARGHGAAATWSNGEGLTRNWVAIDFTPNVEVPSATFSLASGTPVPPETFDVEFLDHAPRDEVVKRFRDLHDAYETWVIQEQSAKVPKDFATAFAGLGERALSWLARMKTGIALLAEDDQAWLAFRLANRAMGMQMVLSHWTKDRSFPIDQKRRPPPFGLKGYAWRPFQIAFLLGVLESTWHESSDDREIVDVIWFPTGGGKTEAYLFLAALELVRRRLAYKDSDTATGIFSRYTLRLLTVQQFQRTSALVCALELIRRADSSALGNRQFSLGLWVGKETTPNNRRDAHDKYLAMMESNKPRNPFPIQACPCCGTEIVPSRPKGRPGQWLLHEFGISSSPAHFSINCPSPDCPFHDGLPLNFVDQELYEHPPSILLGTVDKFAQLPWNDSARSFFGGVNDTSPPPSLVIQDELHLISGPLGSIAAAYEAAVDTIVTLRNTLPKRIASTATIRNAREQVRGLYGRRANVFPIPITRWNDAFFFSTTDTKPGRTYVGVMGQGYTKPVVAMAWTAAALLQAPMELALDDVELNGYWTLLAYHNSRRELGRTIAAARDEVSARIQAIASTEDARRQIGEPLELSAQMVKSLTEALDELKRNHTKDHPAVDFVPCTSIISVGVDVDRLGVMLVNGQPKLTSEYIQATSRIGRGAVPGIVVTLFSPSKPRDRSHYEDFRAYHESIYRHVEPTSVTPYALPSRERTLHAALVSLVRHALPWRKVDTAASVDFDDPGTQNAIEQLLAAMERADSSEAEEVRKLMQRRIKEWREFAEAHSPLFYENRGAGIAYASLLFDFGKPKGLGLWPTMSSVRNVDAEVDVSIS